MAEGDSLTNFSLPNFGNLNSTELLNMFSSDSLFASVGDSIKAAELEILEQPKQRGFRFRYSCEGPSHGGLPGEHSAKGRKSYPSVQITNYFGKARIEVTLVTASDPPQPHAHSLVGKNVVDGACVVEVGPENGMTATFPNLGIQHVTKKNVKAVLKERYLKRRQLEKLPLSGASPEGMNMDVDLRAGSSHEVTDQKVAEAITRQELNKIDQMVDHEAKNMNLSTVRLCFQTYLPNEQGHFVNCLSPVYSNAIFDSKAASASELKICRIDRQSGFVQGGEEVFLLCDKVQKDDIEVRFFATPDDAKPDWEAFGKFSTSDVHRQFAIVFKTPEYWDTAIEKPVTVNIALRRKSDKETSAPINFTYKPTIFDTEQIGAKRRKKVPHFGDIEHSGPSGFLGSELGAGPSGTEPAAAPFLNPTLFPVNPSSFWNIPTSLPGLSGSFTGLSGFPAQVGLPNFAVSGLSGSTDNERQEQYESTRQEPSPTNLP